MAVTTINLSDPVSTLVTKTNTISTNLGDKASLTTAVTTDLVSALNDHETRLAAVDDATEIRALISLSTSDDIISYNNSTGVITFGNVRDRFASDSAGGILYDSTGGQFSLAPNTITSSLFSSSVSLIIYDSAGSPVKTLYSPGS